MTEKRPVAELIRGSRETVREVYETEEIRQCPADGNFYVLRRITNNWQVQAVKVSNPNAGLFTFLLERWLEFPLVNRTLAA